MSACESIALSDQVHRDALHRSPIYTPLPLAFDGVGLSDVQRETVRMARWALVHYGVFGLGDGTGMGKGRTISGIVREYMTRFGADAVRVVWISANCRLREAAMAELEAVGVDEEDAKKCVLFSSYAGHARTRAASDRVRDHLGQGAVRLLVCDECHLLRTRCVLYDRLHDLMLTMTEDTAVLYSSATMLSDPSHLLYLSPKFGLHGSDGAPFADEDEMRRALAGATPALMEMVAMNLRARGLYVCRTLSLDDAEFEQRAVALTSAQRMHMDTLTAELRRRRVISLTSQRVVFTELAKCKLPTAFEIADEALERGDTPIFIVTRTGEAAFDRATSSRRDHDAGPTDDDSAAYLLLDAIVSRYGSDQVAEITGRSRRRASEPGTVERVPRDADIIAFQTGAKRVAILSRAGGVGLSLHDTGGCRRVNIVLELPWSSEDLVQIIGRTHRAAGVTTPRYVLLTTDVPSEQRVAYSLARRLRAMGALTRGDRRACDTLGVDRTFGGSTTPDERRAIHVQLRIAQSLKNLRVVQPCVASRLHSAMVQAIDRVERRPPQKRPKCNVVIQRADAIVHHNVLMMQDYIYDIDTDAHRAILHDTYWLHIDQILFDDNYLLDKTLCMMSARCVGVLPEEGLIRWIDGIVDIAVDHRDAVVPLIVRWSPETNHLFGVKTHALVRQLLMLHSCEQASSTFGLLTHDIMLDIIARTIDVDIDDTVVPTRAHATHESLLHDMLLRPVAAQKNIVHLSRIARTMPLRDGATTVRDEEPYTDVCKFVLARAGRGIRASVVGIESREGGVVVIIDYAVELPPSPPDNSLVWRNVRSDSLSFSTSKTPHRATTIDGDHIDIAHHMHERVPTTEWYAATARRTRTLRNRCDILPRRVRLATTRALHAWSTSMKRVVIATHGDRSVIGLVIAIR